MPHDFITAHARASSRGHVSAIRQLCLCGEYSLSVAHENLFKATINKITKLHISVSVEENFQLIGVLPVTAGTGHLCSKFYMV